MPFLGPGIRVGPYEIVSALGAGGMGEVYRARDTKLGRDVAIKVLPSSLTSDPDRLARFSREAQVLAALNHPNIAAIYHVEETTDGPAIVMELVEGETLAERIARGPIPVDEALPIAKQIADALEAAHEQGIIHRDLKPANIKLTPNGTVKVLDFGLAKLHETGSGIGDPRPARAALSVSPTITSPALMTGVGVLLGTAAYMSPEQAKGRPADKRTDVWAFGCVFYEMLAGKRAFPGDDIADTFAAILRGEPDWNALPKTTPAGVRRVLSRCLRKDTARRLAAIEAVRLEIEEPLTEQVEAPTRTTTPFYRRTALWPSVAVVAALAAMALWMMRPAPPPIPPVAFQIAAPAGTTLVNGSLSMSPDGRYLAFAANGSDGTPRIWVRPLASLDARSLPGTENAVIRRAGGGVRVTAMAWSPDGRALAFEQQAKIRKIDIATGALQTICDSSCGEPGSWGPDGTILTWMGGRIGRITASGGSVTPIAVPDQSSGHAFEYQYPSFLPDGRHFVFLRASNNLPTAIFIGSLDNAADRQENLMLRTLVGQTPIAYVQASTRDSGHLLFVQDDVLVAQPFDARRLALAGEPVHLLDDVGRAGGSTAFFAASLNGTLAFRHGSAARVLVWYDADGNRLRSLDEIQEYTRAELQLSPDGTKLITTGPFPTLASWLIDLDRDVKMRITADGINAHAIWSPDGKRIAFSRPSGNKWALSTKPSDGSAAENVVTETAGEVVPNDWSADGRYVLYSLFDAKTNWDLWALPLKGNQPASPIARTASAEVRGQFSPDGRWIAYESAESGERQIYVKPFGTNGGTDDRRWTIDAGAHVRWSHDGKRLFYRRGGVLVSVDVMSGEDFRTGAPRTVFSINGPGSGDSQNPYYDVSPDGRFLVTSFPEQNLTAPITVLLNWRAALTQ